VLSLGPVQVPYPLFATLGLATWQLFATGLVSGSSALVKAGSMITKVNFSRKTLVLATCSQAVIPFLVQCLLAAALAVAYRWTPPAAAMWAPLAVIPLALLTCGLALLLALLNGVFRDVGTLVALLVTFLMLLTPVLYSRPRVGALALVTDHNPLFYLVNAPRDLVLSGRLEEPRAFALVSGLSVIVFLVCLVGFHLTEVRVAERV
jgi:ABC-type polysaccharide/polyol phosphate export permease